MDTNGTGRNFHKMMLQQQDSLQQGSQSGEHEGLIGRGSVSGMRELLQQLRVTIASAKLSEEEVSAVAPVSSEIERLAVKFGIDSIVPSRQESALLGTKEAEALKRELERTKAVNTMDRIVLDTLLNQSPHGVLICDEHGKIILQNKASERIWAGSATAEDVGGWGQYRAYHPDGSPYEATDWAMARCLTKREVMAAEEVHFQRFDDSHGILLGSAAPLIDSDGRLLGAISIFADMTHLKSAERDLKHALRARDEILQVVSHDLRSPLTAISANVGLMLRLLPDTQETTMQRRATVSIQRSAERMNRLISDLLDLGLIDGGNLKMDPTGVSAHSLVNDTVEMFEPIALQKMLHLSLQIHSEDCTLICDRERVLRVFSNLVGNAVKFTPEGGIISIRSFTEADRVVFEIEDTGPGIPEDQVKYVFDRYWQAHKTARQGCGLGLSIAKGFVEAHGGGITVESRPGFGTRFQFWLPLTETQGRTSKQR